MNYTNVHVNISVNKQQKLKHAVDTKSPVSIRLGHADLCGGDDVLALTNSQVNRMIKAYQDGKGITMKMSKRQVVHNMKIEGGFLGMLADLAAKALPFLAKTVLPTLATGALSGVGSALAQKATNKAMGNGLYLKKGSNIAGVVRRVWGWSGEDCWSGCGVYFTFAGAGRERIKNFNPSRTLYSQLIACECLRTATFDPIDCLL